MPRDFRQICGDVRRARASDDNPRPLRQSRSSRDIPRHFRPIFELNGSRAAQMADLGVKPHGKEKPVRGRRLREANSILQRQGLSPNDRGVGQFHVVRKLDLEVQGLFNNRRAVFVRPNCLDRLDVTFADRLSATPEKKRHYAQRNAAASG